MSTQARRASLQGGDGMSTAERLSPLDAAHLTDELHLALGERTIEILEYRRRTALIKRRGWLVRRMLLVADILGLTISFALVEVLFPASAATPDHVNPVWELLLFLATLPIWIVVAKLYGLYDHDEERTDHSTADDLVGVFHVITVGSWVIFAGAMLTGLGRPELLRFVFFWGLAIAGVTGLRALARGFCRRRISYLQNAVIVGAGDVGQLIAHKLLQHAEYGINLVGFVDDEPKERRADLEHLPLLGPPERLPAIVRAFDVERVVIAFSNESHEETIALIRSLNELGVQVDIVPRLFEIVGPGVGLHTIEGVPLIGLPPIRLSRSSQFIKRTVDVCVSALGLIALAPLLAVIALRIKVDSPGPVFFRQIRVGIGDNTFEMCKFRTMTVDADARKGEVAHLNMHAENGGDGRMFKIPDDPRTTKFGHFLRRYSLDELPQLINVLKGDMSLVGPRPLILEEDKQVADWARKRLFVKPGITGLWQVLGRSDIPFEEMTRLDYLYVINWSLGRDLSLMLRTIPAMFRVRRAY
jgi:exopolysaccharide biosynthesis polyprenyl glycosylphosphotransferase